MTMAITVHALLADMRTTHASADGGRAALCKRVKAYSLCVAIEQGPPTCPVCAARLARLAR